MESGCRHVLNPQATPSLVFSASDLGIASRWDGCMPGGCCFHGFVNRRNISVWVTVATSDFTKTLFLAPRVAKDSQSLHFEASHQALSLYRVVYRHRILEM